MRKLTSRLAGNGGSAIHITRGDNKEKARLKESSAVNQRKTIENNIPGSSKQGRCNSYRSKP